MRALMASLAVASLIIGSSANAAGWLCKEEHSSGFSYSKATRSWGNAKFNTGAVYVVRASSGTNAKWEVTELGNEDAIALCPDGPNSAGVFFCEGHMGDFKINTKNGRFLHIYLYGYWTYNPDVSFLSNEGADTPSMSIGKCSAI